MHRRCLLVSLAAFLAGTLLVPGHVAAQDWPNRPVTMVVPYAAGGPVDTIGRIIAARLTELLDQQVIIENIGGAGGMTGSDRVAKAAPDGYTFLLGGLAVLGQVPNLYKKPLYDPVTDFAPVALFADSPRILITRHDLPVSTLTEFMAYTKANHANMQFGSAGAGTGMHVCAVLLNDIMGIDITHIPYRGSAPAMQDVIGGRIDYVCEQISTAFPLIQSGAVKAIATLGPDRVPVLANIPTAHESGVDGLDCGSWSAFVFPKGTPDAIVRRLAKATSEAVDTPAVRERFEGVGVTVVPPERRSPEYLARFVASELAKWAGPMRAAGLNVQ